MAEYMVGVRQGREAHGLWIKSPGTPRPLNPHEKDTDLWRGWHDGFEMEVLKGDY